VDPSHYSRSSSTVVVVAAIIEQQGSFLLTERQAGTHLEHHWEFPGGKLEEGETHHEALVRELSEELGVNVTVGELALSTIHAYPDRTVALHFYRCAIQGEPRPMLGQAMRWIPRGDLDSLQLPPADAELIRLLTSEGDR
jgi:8-oxo-dGTP diphosphatase